MGRVVIVAPGIAARGLENLPIKTDVYENMRGCVDEKLALMDGVYSLCVYGSGLWDVESISLVVCDHSGYPCVALGIARTKDELRRFAEWLRRAAEKLIENPFV